VNKREQKSSEYNAAFVGDIIIITLYRYLS